MTPVQSCCSSPGSTEDTGRRFVVSFPGGDEQWNSQPFLVAIPTGNSKITITARMPNRTDLLQPISRTAEDGEPATILLPANLLQGTPSRSLESNGTDSNHILDVSLFLGVV